MMHIKKKYHFYAAHRNKEAGEKCGRIHGHTYDVTCYFKFPSWEEGVSMLFSEIDDKAEPCIKHYDHYFILYEHDALVPILHQAGEQFRTLPFQTSAENLAQHLFNQIKETGLPIRRLDLAETKSSTVTYEP